MLRAKTARFTELRIPRARVGGGAEAPAADRDPMCPVLWPTGLGAGGRVIVVFRNVMGVA